ncbi:hypothetical protein [Miltoncostaea marina]|uniref:hypothetical protein n=1 Tax=Miltoncostaea marina TaxID=2843215 RepID=UPI001C3D20B1|nr:hypothetical protein [Miltoncostaea marina]
MSDDTARGASAPAQPRPAPIGDPLLPRAEEAELPRRARAAAELVAGFQGSARLDNRFCLAVRDLSRAIVGLEGMRAVGFSTEIAADALPRLSEVLGQVERALERARPELEAERRQRAQERRPAARSGARRAPGSAGASR